VVNVGGRVLCCYVSRLLIQTLEVTCADGINGLGLLSVEVDNERGDVMRENVRFQRR
jgi:hypothetical protein